MMLSHRDPDELSSQADLAASVMRSIAHRGRLLVLCYLADEGEMSAGELVRRIGLGQSALSQHLSRLRADGLVETRKVAQSVIYRIADERVVRLLSALHDIYCPAIRIVRSVEPDRD